jgi:hypothetical protein
MRVGHLRDRGRQSAGAGTVEAIHTGWRRGDAGRAATGRGREKERQVAALPILRPWLRYVCAGGWARRRARSWENTTAPWQHWMPASLMPPASPAPPGPPWRSGSATTPLAASSMS